MSTAAGDGLEELRFVVTAAEAGQRLDTVLVRHGSGMGRRAAARLCAAGQVSVDGRRARKGTVLLTDQLVVACFDRAVLLGAAEPAPDFPLVILLQTPALVIVDKPAGVPTTSLPDKSRGTLAGALLARYPELDGVGRSAREPGLLHRLDTMTSGVVLAARTNTAFEHLRAELEAGRIEKRYLAITPDGIPNSGAMATPLGPHPSDPRRVVAMADGLHRQTSYVVRERKGGWALVEVTAHRAYRHQVRAHLALAGFPLAGDALYGGAEVGLAPRHALHASYIAGAAPDGTRFSASAPLASDLSAFWADPPPR